MQVQASIAAIESELRAVGSRERAEGEKLYLKSDLTFLGVSVPKIRRQAKLWLGFHPDLARTELVSLVRALWQGRVHELRTFGVEILIFRVQSLIAEDLATIEWILGRANTWAHVDAIAVKIVGPLVAIHPQLEPDLDRWSGDENFWLRRAALLAHLIGLRTGAGDWNRFTRYAQEMLEEREFFIRKAIGWVLREAAKSTPERVLEFLDANIDRVSGLTLREATRHLASSEQDRLRLAYRNCHTRVAGR